MAERGSKLTLGSLVLAAIPVVLLAGLVWWLIDGGADALFGSDLPPVEELHVMRHTLDEDRIHLDVVNSGPDQTTIAQVIVRGAFWYHEVEPSRELHPLDRARVTIPYPWNEGEPVEIALLTGTGLTFDYEIEVATRTPEPTPAAFGRFALLGLFVGAIPVALGLTWFPFLRRLGGRGVSFFIHLTVGLLAFLVIDALEDGLEVAHELPGIYHGQALLALGFFGALLSLSAVTVQTRARSTGGISSGLTVAWMIALGIGLHNLGEGLAIGSAYVLGELTLGALLVVGFTVHNATEGIAIVSPILEQGAPLARLAGLGAVAGLPTVLGCWIGAFSYSQVWALLFLGVGAGAIVQVIGAILGGKSLTETLAPLNLAGLFAGYLLMYATGMLVGAA
jgi:zinc transporter ZupT